MSALLRLLSYATLVGVALWLTACTTLEPAPASGALPSVKAAIEAVTPPPAAVQPEAGGLISPFKLLSDAIGKLGHNKLLTAVGADADATLAWIDQMQATTPPTLSPLAEFRARACPTAVKVATADLQQKIQILQAVLGSVDAQISGFDPTQPEIILFFTKLRYGPAAGGIAGLDPKAAIAQLKQDVAERVTAVVDSCRALIPLKQIDEVVQLAGKAGLLVGTGGAAGPLMGILP
jgi:hypothetical protein